MENMFELLDTQPSVQVGACGCVRVCACGLACRATTTFPTLAHMSLFTHAGHPVPRAQPSRHGDRLRTTLCRTFLFLPISHGPKHAQDLSGCKQLVVSEARVDFENVVFGYGGPTAPPVLKGVTFCVPGETRAHLGKQQFPICTLVRDSRYTIPALHPLPHGHPHSGHAASCECDGVIQRFL